MKKLALVLLCASLAGCGDSEVDLVRESTVVDFFGYTYGKVLDNHKVCADSEWKSYKEDGVKKVSYTCNLKKGEHVFNYDEKEAAAVHKQAAEEYINRNVESMTSRLDSFEKALTDRINTQEKKKELLKVKDYFKYSIENEYSFSVEIRQAIGELANNNSPVFSQIDMLFEGRGYGYETSSQLISTYREKLNTGMTAEETKAFKDISVEIGRRLASNLKYSIEREDKELARFKEQFNEDKAVLEDKATLKKEANKEGDKAVNQYARYHAQSGTEFIIWAWNPALERYDLQSQFMREHQHKDQYQSFALRTEALIYSAAKNISNVDDYIRYQQTR